MTQTIAVKYEVLNTLTNQLRAAGAVLKVAKGSNETFNITIRKLPVTSSVEDIICYSPNVDNSIMDVEAEEIIDIEAIQLPDEINSALVKETNSKPKGRKKPAKSKLKLEDLPTCDDDDDIPF